MDYIACAMLGTITAAVYDRFDIEAKKDHKIPLTLYQFAIGKPGTQKSAPFNIFPDKLRKLTDEKNKEIRRKNHFISEKIADIKKAERKKKKTDDEKPAEEAEDTGTQIQKLEEQIRPLYPSFPTDATLEALRVLQSKSMGCVSVIAGEGNIVNVIAGLSYSQRGQQPNIDSILESYDRHRLEVCRVGYDLGDNGVIDNACMSICVAAQPAVLNTMMQTGEQAKRGFPDRALFYYPKQTFDHDATKETPFDWRLLKRWNEKIVRLFNAGRKRRMNYITLSPETKQLYDDYRNKCYKLAEQYQHDGAITGWIGKAADKVLRFAGILMLMENPDGREITEPVMRKAISFFDNYEFKTALICYGVSGEELTNDQAKVMEKISELINREGRCLPGKLKDSLRGKRWENLQSMLYFLEHNDYIRKQSEKLENKTIPYYIVNPTYKG